MLSAIDHWIVGVTQVFTTEAACVFNFCISSVDRGKVRATLIPCAFYPCLSLDVWPCSGCFKPLIQDIALTIRLRAYDPSLVHCPNLLIVH